MTPSISRTSRPARLAVLALAAVAFVLTAATASAQTGKLSGRIVDGNGEPLIGATVLVVGTSYGAATDIDGYYNVLRIPPGTVDVRFSSIGFQTQTIEGIQISSNTTTELNVTLRDETVTGEEVIVTAEQPIVDVTQTSSISTIGRDEIAALPVQELGDVVNLQAGVVDGHFRGGRLGEVQFQVDGVSVNNPFNNTSTVTLDRSVLQEVQVISGTFDAEYGQALSGVVNAVLRTGDAGRYEASFEVFGGDYFSPGNDSTLTRTRIAGQEVVAQVPLRPYVSRIDPTARMNFQASLSGPVPFVPSTTFLVNGQRFIDNGLLAGERRFVPTDSSNFETNEFNPTGDGEIVPLQYNRRWSYLAKVSNSSIPNVRLDYQIIGSVRDALGANYAYRFNPDGLSTQNEISFVHGVGIQHSLSNNVFYELSLRQNYFDFSDYVFEDLGTLPETGTRVPLPEDSPYFQAGRPIGSQNFENGAIIQGYDLGRFVQRTNAYVAKGAVTAQATNVHFIKAGFELQRSTVEFGTPGSIQPLIIDGVQRLGVLRDTLGAQVIDFQPVQAAAFVQDRIEWRDLRVRAGLRLEYFDPNATVPSDLANPANSIEGAPESRPVDASVKLVLAPRLGVSFPFLDRASLFFSYGHFYQFPGLGTFFSNADYSVLQDLQQGNEGSQGILGNPDLDPEFTAQYEFGFKSRVTRDLGLDVSLFYKDIRDLLGVEFIQTYTAAQYARWTNVDFGNVRGFTISVDQRALGPLSTTLDYSFQIASGNTSDPRETFNRVQAGDDALPRVAPFNWDQRHTLNATAILAARDNYNVTGILRMGSGQPYTPSLGTGFGANLEPNSGRKDLSVVVDLRAEKVLNFGGFGSTAFVRVFNVFDSYYQNGFVFADTGSPFYTLNPQQQLNPDPTRFAAPRRIEIGISLNASRAVRR